MEFFDKLGKKASEAYKITADKTGKIAREAKLKMKMGELKSEISDIYEDIGKVVYEKHRREEYDISKELEEQCTKIDMLSDEIESYLRECLQLKDRKQCSNCYTEIEKSMKFCPECGTKQEVENEVAKEVEIVEKQNTNNNNQKNSNETEKTNLEKTVEVEADVKPDDNETVEYLEIEEE